jgi:hypothetical protein
MSQQAACSPEIRNPQGHPPSGISKSASKRGTDWLLRGWISLCLALLLNLFTGLISGPGWYAANPVLRWQTDAFFRGQTALSSSPYDLPHDTVWEHGVQQVWGLGVPAFRFIFEMLARISRQAAFPDRITFLIACAACYWFLIGTFAGPRGKTGLMNASQAGWKIMRVPWILGLLIFAPPFVTLVKARFDFYEEVAAYGYLYSLVLFGGFLRVARGPAVSGLLLLSLWAGLGVWIRPTLLFYGVVTIALAIVIAWRARTGVKVIAGMLLIFGFCGAGLGYSNLKRFGGFAEFGHSLNLESKLNPNTFSLKFNYPFRQEPFLSAAMDQMGSLFFVRKLNGADFYKHGVVWGQSPTFRWHEMYFTTFNLVYLVFFIASVILWLRHFKWLRASWIASHDPQVTKDPDQRPLGCVFGLFTVPWAVLSFVCLFGFYLWSPSLSSRYSVDFLPAVMIGICALVWNVVDLNILREKAQGLQWMVATAAWLAIGIFAARISEGYVHSSTDLAMIQRRALVPLPKKPPEALTRYELGQPDWSARIPFNCDGWNPEDGTVQPAVTLFASDPQCVVLSLFVPGESRITSDDLAPIQAKIGLEYLSRQSVEIQSDKATLVFNGPHRQRYQTGLQVCFLGFIRPEDLGKKNPKLRLASVSFAKTNMAEFASAKMRTED